MRVAYVCADRGVPVFGTKGCSVHVQEVVRALLRLGAEVHLFAARPGGPAPADLAGARLHPLPDPPKGDPAARERAALAANDDLRAALERAGRFDLVWERYALWSYAGMEYARDRGTPGVLEVNAPLVEEQAAHRTLVDRGGAEAVAARVFAAADVLAAVSAEVAEYLGRFPGVRGRVHVVPNGVDPARFPAGLRPSRRGPAGSFTVGFVGTLKPWHGLGTLAAALGLLLQRAPGSRLLVVGDGPAREGLEADLAGRGARAAAEFAGATAPADVPGLLASMDAGVAPYAGAGFYFSPLKVFEYMAAGLPVVASRVGQLARLIRDGENGLLVPPGDAAALADALARLHDDPGLRARLGRRARADVLLEHTWGATVRRVLALAGAGREVPVTGVAP
jgi:glycosyltransferase involved in cell wall biosynthesis